MDSKTFLAMLARTGLKCLAGFLVGHGYLQASATEAFIGAGMALAAAAWSFWNDYGAALAKASLDILRDKVQLAAARARKTPALAPEALAKLDAHVAATAYVAGTAPTATPPLLLAIGISTLALAWSSPADAQSRQPPRPTGNPIVDIGNAIKGQQQQGQAETDHSPFEKITADVLQKILVDVTYAQALAKATNNTVTLQCWAAWVDLVTKQTQPVKDDAGNVLTEPNPHFFTAAERASEFINQLQPNSSLNVGCGAALNASKMAVGQMISAVLSGGALGLFKVPFALP
jgi:hypothetical protein